MESKERTLGSRASIFKKTDRVIPELEQQAEDVKRPANKAAKQQRIKATFYINPEDVLAIDEMQSNEFRQTGKKPERSDIVSRAIQAYKEQQDELATRE
ncbi:MAG: hypothetical protein JSV02_10685 [Dehalococcoidia bacterium]|nr:MAG: hypothetical protein JSV02_10685 [Dehalococcoidia bacterium]